MIEANACLFRKKMGKDMFSLWFMNAKRSKHTRNKFKQKQTTVLKRLNFYHKVYPKFYRIINYDFLAWIKNRRYRSYVNAMVGLVL